MEEMKPYMPLVITYSLCLIAALAMSLHGESWQGSQFLHYFLGLVLFTQATLKLLSVENFAPALAKYDRQAAQYAVYGQVYPFLQFALALLFLSSTMLITAYLLGLLFTGFSAYELWKALKQKTDAQYVPLGTAYPLPMTPAILLDQAGLALVILLALISYF